MFLRVFKTLRKLFRGRHKIPAINLKRFNAALFFQRKKKKQYNNYLKRNLWPHV